MIIRDKTSNLALLFAWQGTILWKIIPASHDCNSDCTNRTGQPDHLVK